MCGIAGILTVHRAGTGPAPDPLDAIPEAWLDRLDASIRHRGPDAAGRFRDRAIRGDGAVVDVALVHRRLAILDRDGGRQPMVHDGARLRTDLVYQPGATPVLAQERCPAEDGAELVAVVFNGCVYNHRALRAELEDAAHRFETDHSDTEAFVHAWRAWGEPEGRSLRLCHRLNGMYAALIWDRRRACLAPLRDPFGEKPLYVRAGPGVTTWASVASELPDPRDNPWDNAGDAPGDDLGNGLGPGLRRWIRHGWSLGWNGRGLAPEEAGADGTLADGPAVRFGVRSWIANAGRAAEPLTPDRTETLLRRAVARRLEADVPLGSFLSGGVDSSLITKFALDERGSIDAFTVAMPDPGYDESEHAQAAAEAIGADLEILGCDAAPATDLVTLIETLGLPFGDSSLLPTYWVCRAAARRVRVALAGDGGDELFHGYERHMVGPGWARMSGLMRLVPLGAIPDRDPRSPLAKLRRLLGAARGGRGAFAPELAAIFQEADLRRLLGPGRSAGWGPQASSVRLWDLDAYLRGDLLRKTDTASMQVPIEVRCPFLDPELAEAAIGTPAGLLAPRGRRKGLLRAVARRHLPETIVDRPKQGFAIPVGRWFRTDYGGMRRLLHEHLGSSDPFPGLADLGVRIDRARIERMLREHDAAGTGTGSPWRGRDHAQRLYMLLVLSIWARWRARKRAGGPASGPPGRGA